MEKFVVFEDFSASQYINKVPQKYWGFAYLRPRSEKKTALSLNGKGIMCYLPLMAVGRMHHGTKVISQKPMLPGYIFLAVNDEERTELKKTDNNIIHIELLRSAAAENKLIEELNALRRFELLAQKEKVLINPGIQKGDRVLITEGPLKGLTTEVIRRNDECDSIVVNISILNRNIEYPVSAETLQKITD